MAATSEPLRLAAGTLTLDLVPALGGSVAAFRRGTTDLFRPLSQADHAAGRVVGTAMFPMVPYANRIAGNAVIFRGARVEVAANNPPERFNVHGTGWHRPWHLREAGADRACLTVEVAGADQPWHYRATQQIRLDPAGLSVRLVLENIGARTMPFGFGLHPWFPRDADVTLAFQAARFHPEGPDMVALPAVPVPGWTGAGRRGPLPARRLNNDFGGWTGRVDLAFPGRDVAMRITADPVFGHLMIYADPGQPVFCAEPQSNAAGALGRDPEGLDPAEGVVVLPPGAAMSGTVRFDVDYISRASIPPSA